MQFRSGTPHQKKRNWRKNKVFWKNLVALWQSNSGWRRENVLRGGIVVGVWLLCGWERAWDNDWLKRLLLFRELFVENGGIETGHFLKVSGWIVMISGWRFEAIPCGYWGRWRLKCWRIVDNWQGKFSKFIFAVKNKLIMAKFGNFWSLILVPRWELN